MVVAELGVKASGELDKQRLWVRKSDMLANTIGSGLSCIILKCEFLTFFRSLDNTGAARGQSRGEQSYSVAQSRLDYNNNLTPVFPYDPRNPTA